MFSFFCCCQCFSVTEKFWQCVQQSLCIILIMESTACDKTGRTQQGWKHIRSTWCSRWRGMLSSVQLCKTNKQANKHYRLWLAGKSIRSSDMRQNAPVWASCCHADACKVMAPRTPHPASKCLHTVLPECPYAAEPQAHHQLIVLICLCHQTPGRTHKLLISSPALQQISTARSDKTMEGCLQVFLACSLIVSDPWLRTWRLY